MTDSACAAETDARARLIARAEERARMLDAYARMAMDISLRLHGLIMAPDEEDPTAGRAEAARLTQAFDRSGRALRLSLRLQARFDAELKAALDGRGQETKAAPRAEPGPADWIDRLSRTGRRKHVVAAVVDGMIEARAESDGALNERELKAEAESLLDEEIDDADILNRPIPELIGVLCAALEVEPDWSLWDPAEWTDRDWGLTEAEIDAGGPAPRPRRLAFPPPKAELANDQGPAAAPTRAHAPP